MGIPRLQSYSSRQIIQFMPSVMIFIFLLIVGFGVEGSQQFSELAQSLLHGHLYFLHSIGGEGQDPVLFGGHVYWSEGAFPAVLLLPFVAFFSLFHLFFYQGYLKWVLVLLCAYFVFQVAKKLRYNSEDSLVLTFGFILGSIFIGVASVSSSWLFAQVVTAFLLLWSLYEYYHNKRWWLIGLLCGLTFLTRATAAPVVLFFALELWQTKLERSDKLKSFIAIGAPLIVALGLQGLYNTLRFHSPFNGGYQYQLLGPGPAASRALGVFSLQHIPANLYALILSTPITFLQNPQSWILRFPFIGSNPDGLSIFITSPYLLYLFTKKWSSFDRTTRNLLVAAAVSCFGVLCFYGLGRDQLGDRYSLDFFPELFLIFMIVYRKSRPRITNGMKFLLLAAGVFNFYMLLTFVAW